MNGTAKKKIPDKPGFSTQTRGRLGNRILRELRKNLGLYLLVVVPLTYLILFKYIPIYGVQIAFKNYSPVRSFSDSPWVGLKHFQRFMSTPRFFDILWNTLTISLYSLLTFPLPIILALLLNYMTSRRYKKIVQLISYAPHFISTVVMVGIILQFLDTRSGIINVMIKLAGKEPVNFMGTSQYFYHIYVWSGVWQGIGYSSIIYIASLAGVPPELHEAAIVDGATILQRIRHIDLPSILPTASILLILACGGILSVGYEKVYLMQNNLNSKVSEVISTYVYKQGIIAAIPQYSYATAIGLFISVINVVILITVNRLSDKIGGNSLF
ncbi:MAG: ABC transporter permease subunit [Treponema sp.]|jgi:ABC-type polysaccharide transport system permease subunit|nr:ABC transporter permease subunit [Treponema sp.]